MISYNYYVPISFPNPDLDALPKRRWELLPGFWFEKIPQRLIRFLKEKNSKHDSFFQDYDANYAIRIDVNNYNNGLAKRIRNNATEVSDNSKELVLNLLQQPKVTWVYPNKEAIPHYDTPDPHDMAKLLLISFCLQKTIRFSKGNTYCFSEEKVKKRLVYSGGYRATNRQPIESLSYRLTYCKSLFKFKGGFNKNKLLVTIQSLERYFRPYLWYTDRLAFSLKYIWNALTAPSPDQIFLNMAIALECLLSTNSMEVTHTLSERAAVMLGNSASERFQIYQDLKNIYKTRSSIVHGRGETKKKGPISYGSYHISPKFSEIPIEQIADITKVVFRLIQATLQDKELLSLIQTLKKEDSINKDLNKYYMKKLLGGFGK